LRATTSAPCEGLRIRRRWSRTAKVHECIWVELAVLILARVQEALPEEKKLQAAEDYG